MYDDAVCVVFWVTVAAWARRVQYLVVGAAMQKHQWEHSADVAGRSSVRVTLAFEEERNYVPVSTYDEVEESFVLVLEIVWVTTFDESEIEFYGHF